jgi:hypothetical protein
MIKLKRLIKVFMRWFFCKEDIHFGCRIVGRSFLEWDNKKSVKKYVMKECLFCEEIYPKI